LEQKVTQIEASALADYDYYFTLRSVGTKLREKAHESFGLFASLCQQPLRLRRESERARRFSPLVKKSERE
jgi:hypothetical protein